LKWGGGYGGTEAIGRKRAMSGEEFQKEKIRKAKLSAIERFFEKWEQRVGFLLELFASGHEEEALLLACCYIEALGNALYWDARGSNYNFVRVLKEHSGEERFQHIHPQQLRIGLAEARQKRVQKIGNTLDKVLGKFDRKLYTEDEILALLSSHVDASELEELKQNLWRGTLAAFAYQRIRSEHVHTVSGPIAFMPSDGTDLPDFLLLYGALQRIFQAAMERSVTSVRWFGHDKHLS
jgi:hypothetical protein